MLEMETDKSESGLSDSSSSPPGCLQYLQSRAESILFEKYNQNPFIKVYFPRWPSCKLYKKYDALSIPDSNLIWPILLSPTPPICTDNIYSSDSISICSVFDCKLPLRYTFPRCYGYERSDGLSVNQTRYIQSAALVACYKRHAIHTL